MKHVLTCRYTTVSSFQPACNPIVPEHTTDRIASKRESSRLGWLTWAGRPDGMQGQAEGCNRLVYLKPNTFVCLIS